MEDPRAIHRQNLQQIREKDAELARLDQEYPVTFLDLRSPEARAFFAQIKNVPLPEQIAAIQGMPDHFVQNPCLKPDGSVGNEINAILEFLGVSKRLGYAHGFRGLKTDFSSDWGYFDVQRGIKNSFVACNLPKKSADALVFLLSLS